MHEMSIAQSIVELAEEQARNRHSEAVEELELEIGRLAGVELHTLDFALESAVKGSMLEHRRRRGLYGLRAGLSDGCFIHALSGMWFLLC